MKTVLVVEDEPQLLQLWVEAIRAAGYEVIGVQSASMASRMVPYVRPHMVVLDLLMPPGEPDGLHFLDIVRQRYPYPPPILIVSSMADAINLEAARYFGVVAARLKPMEPDELLQAVKMLAGPA